MLDTWSHKTAPQSETAPPAPTHHGLGAARSRWIIGTLLLTGAVLIGWRLDLIGPSLFSAPAPRIVENTGAKPALKLTPGQLANIRIEEVRAQLFRPEIVTEGKIAPDENRLTPVFSPYSGRVIRIFVQPGAHVEQGAPLFALEANEMVQAQSDLLSASGALNKARSQLNIAETSERRMRSLGSANAVAQREVQQAQNDLVLAQNDLRTAEVALEAARNRLRILGKRDGEIDTFQKSGVLAADTTINAPLSGLVVQRKIGPGQYLTNNSNDPALVIGDTSKVWLIANVRETDAPSVFIGQRMDVRLMAYPDRVFEASVAYMSPSVDPATRRIIVRAEIDNADGVLKTDMFARVRLFGREEVSSPAVPRKAIIYEADKARVWAALPDGSFALRNIETGMVSGDNIQAVSGLSAGEKIVTSGSLFIDRAFSETN